MSLMVMMRVMARASWAWRVGWGWWSVLGVVARVSYELVRSAVHRIRSGVVCLVVAVPGGPFGVELPGPGPLSSVRDAGYRQIGGPTYGYPHPIDCPA